MSRWGPSVRFRTAEEDFLILGIVWSAKDFSWNPWMSPPWWAPVVKIVEQLGGLRVYDTLALSHQRKEAR